jgi:hypothetical protein
MSLAIKYDDACSICQNPLVREGQRDEIESYEKRCSHLFHTACLTNNYGRKPECCPLDHKSIVVVPRIKANQEDIKANQEDINANPQNVVIASPQVGAAVVQPIQPIPRSNSGELISYFNPCSDSPEPDFPVCCRNRWQTEAEVPWICRNSRWRLVIALVSFVIAGSLIGMTYLVNHSQASK